MNMRRNNCAGQVNRPVSLIKWFISYWLNFLLKNSIKYTLVIDLMSSSYPTVSGPQLGFPFAKLLAIFAERNAKFFFLCASVLREKTTICAIIRKSHFAQNCLLPLLRNSSFAQFRNFVKIKRLVTVCFLWFNSGRILFWNVFLLVTFT